MELTGSYIFNARPERVWDLLMDPETISSCIPGSDRFEPAGDDRYRVRLTVALAAITGSYDGQIALTEKVPPASYRLIADGQGRPGFVKGDASISLRPEGETTVVTVSGSVHTGGPIARLGQRLVSGVAKMIMDRFFGCLQSKISPTSASTARD
jgi:carbon monoxide dehydrogenase subunit G